MSAEACESEDLSDPGVLHRGGRFRNSSSISLRGERGGQVAPPVSSCLAAFTRSVSTRLSRQLLGGRGTRGGSCRRNDVDEEDVDDRGGLSGGVGRVPSADGAALHAAELCERVLSAGRSVRDGRGEQRVWDQWRRVLRVLRSDVVRFE